VRPIPQFAHSPEYLRTRNDLRLRLLLCGEEMRARYRCPVYLCGSGLETADPQDWDIRPIVESAIFGAYDTQYWGIESAMRTEEQRKMNLLPFDVRIYPDRLWYSANALRLDDLEFAAEPVEAPHSEPSAECVEENKRMIEANKDKPEFHIFLGAMLFLRGDKQTALQAFVRALQLDPNNAGAWLNLGNVYYEFGEFRRAAIYYRRALLLKPDYAKGWINMANSLSQLGFYASALPFYEHAIKLDPTIPDAHHNRANCLTALKRYPEADVALNRAFEIKADQPFYLNTLGNLRSSEGYDYAAAAAYRVAIMLAPRHAPLYTNLGNIYANFGRSEEAVLNYERGLLLDPKNPGVRYNLALAYLRAGNYRLGWKAYEGRWGFRDLGVKKREFPQPLWKGEPLCGKKILVHAEQGLGDTMQFCRYIPLVAKRGGVVYFEVQHGLQRLMANVDGVRVVCTRGLKLPEFDVHCPLMSMPAIFETDIDTVPLSIPYVHPWKWEVEKMLKRFPRTGRLRVGISWAGNPKYKKDRVRSFSLLEFAPLMEIDGVDFYSLQKGAAARQIDKYSGQIRVIDASSDAVDFAESAALVETLDLVITSDSAPMHLAASMGKEVWLALAYLPDWRWMASGDKTPWYPNVRLFRQSAPGDWRGVFLEIKNALENKMNVLRVTQDKVDCVVMSGLAPDVAKRTANILNSSAAAGIAFITDGGEHDSGGHPKSSWSEVPPAAGPAK
jgi:tetratricopeptide (TPR) repeat protein